MNMFGAQIERGRIISITDEGARVASTERPGIVTMPLRPIFRKAMQLNWPVFFMEYEDGSGLIISHQNPEMSKDEVIVGPPGVDGKSAYQLWLDDGNAGTLADYFESLRGPAGRDGEQGLQGIPGVPGSDATVTKAAVELVLTGTITTHNHSGAYAPFSHNHTKANITDFAHTHPLGELTGITPAAIGAVSTSNYTAADVKSKVLSVDGPGSLINSDLLDDLHASDFARANEHWIKTYTDPSQLGLTVTSSTTLEQVVEAMPGGSMLVFDPPTNSTTNITPPVDRYGTLHLIKLYSSRMIIQYRENNGPNTYFNNYYSGTTYGWWKVTLTAV